MQNQILINSIYESIYYIKKKKKCKNEKGSVNILIFGNKISTQQN
jgi:hypothetical protein